MPWEAASYIQRVATELWRQIHGLMPDAITKLTSVFTEFCFLKKTLLENNLSRKKTSISD